MTLTAIKAAAIGLILAALVAAGLWAHHAIYAQGAASRQADVDAAVAAQHLAETKANGYSADLKVASDNALAEKARADLAQQQAQAVIDTAGKSKAVNTKAGAVFAQKIQTASQSTDCQSVMKALICQSLAGY